MKRAQLIDHEALKALNDCGDYLLPEEQLAQQLMLSLRPAPTLSEIKERMTHLESRLAVVSVRDDYGVVKFKISERGRAALAEMRI